ncbi:hypothetical protein [Cupriavidus sp. D39]|uniref:hypothetical protein n=1 Tax=Cupriavidus sp. D39 TaxID=2997877 RepID=UPI00226FC90C|nr:hypothetical protein [Cupriavidus sp. D39]MCY0854924.1 hypothetical protein [Cupriavidus sp. D39]
MTVDTMCQIVGDDLVIRIPVSAIAFAAEISLPDCCVSTQCTTSWGTSESGTFLGYLALVPAKQGGEPTRRQPMFHAVLGNAQT